MLNNKTPIYFSLSILFSFLLVFTPLRNLFFFHMVHEGFIYITVFFHELGHALFFWIFGYPSLPSFNFQYGGGETYPFARQWLIQIGMYLIGAYSLYRAKQIGWPTFLIIPLTGLFLVLCAVSLTQYWPIIIGTFMGHGTEAIIGAILISRSLFNIWLLNGQERWLNAIIGSHIIFFLIQNMWQIAYDPEMRDWYMGLAESQGVTGDILKISETAPAPWTYEGVATFTIIYTIVTTVTLPTFIYWITRRR